MVPNAEPHPSTSTASAAGLMPLPELTARARAGDDACRLELLARWCAGAAGGADARVGDAVWEQFRRLLYRWVFAYADRRGLAVELLCDGGESLDDLLDSLAAQVLMRFYEGQAGQGFRERFPSMGHVIRYLARVTWTVTADHAQAMLRRRRVTLPLPETEDAALTVLGAAEPPRHEPFLPERPRPAPAMGARPPEEAPDTAADPALWERVRGHCRGQAEWVAMLERYARDAAPRDILARHPAHFASVGEVYKAIERVLGRLRKDALMAAAHGGGAA